MITTTEHCTLATVDVGRDEVHDIVAAAAHGSIKKIKTNGLAYIKPNAYGGFKVAFFTEGEDML